MEGEIAMVIMLNRTNILALVESDNNMNPKRSKLSQYLIINNILFYLM